MSTRTPRRQRERDRHDERMLTDSLYASAIRKRTREYLAEYRKEHPERDRLRAYKYSAKKKNRAWALDDQRAYDLFFAECFYCAKEPSEKANGIDRVQNKDGYLPANVVPCCFQCNDTKSDYSPAEFDAWATRFAATWPRRREEFLRLTRPHGTENCTLKSEPSPSDHE
jgi:5-methylcytosine-specific restriction endonuclease McrA